MNTTDVTPLVTRYVTPLKQRYSRARVRPDPTRKNYVRPSDDPYATLNARTDDES